MKKNFMFDKVESLTHVQCGYPHTSYPTGCVYKYTPYELVFGKVCILLSKLNSKLEPLYNFYSYPFELKYRLHVSIMPGKIY